MRFCISIHQLDPAGAGGLAAAGLRDYLTRAEELGFEGGWVLEQTVGEAPLLAPLELLAQRMEFEDPLTGSHRRFVSPRRLGRRR